MTNAVVDRVDFRNANLKNVKMHNAVITGILIEGANLEGASFDEALIGGEDAKRLCVLSLALRLNGIFNRSLNSSQHLPGLASAPHP